MIRSTVFSAIMTAALLLTGSAAMAQSAAGGPQGEQQNQADLTAFQNAKVSLGQIIADVERDPGGKALEASFDTDSGKPAYRVRLYRENAVWEGLLDANTGKLIGEPTNVPEGQLEDDDKAELAALQKAKTSLAEAVRKAEEAAGGKAIDAGIEDRDGKMSYAVEVVKNGDVRAVTVDTATGQATVDTGSSPQK